jgi:CHAT domain-containing protein/tetratricopeptide (TPR) repeat protein
MTLARRGLAPLVCIIAATFYLAPDGTAMLAPLRASQFDVRFESVRTLLETGQYALAESEAAALRADTARTALSTADLLRATDLLIEALCRNGKGAEPATRALAEQVVRSRGAATDSDDQLLSGSLRNLGDVLVESGQYQAAVDPLKRALAIQEGALGPDHGAIADDLDHLARALLWADRLQDASDAANRAVQIRQKTLDPNDAPIASSLEIQGVILQRKGDHAGARPAFERAVALREAARSAPPDLAEALSLLGEQVWFEGDVLKAKEYCTRALSLAEASLRDGHPALAAYQRRLALALNDLGDVVRARELRERALAIARSALGSTHPGTALQMNDLANSLYLQGDYSPAVSLFGQALNVYRALGPDSAGATAATYNLGVVSADLGDYEEAERFYLESIAAWSRVHGAEHPFVAYGLAALGGLRNLTGSYDDARRLYEQALVIRETKLGPNTLDVARTLTSLAKTLLDSNDVPLAFERSSRAVDIWTRSGAEDSPHYVDALNLRAAIQTRMGDLAAARTSYEDALGTLGRLYGPAHPLAGELKRSLAITLAAGGEAAPSIRTALEAEQIERDHVMLTVRYLTERQALGYAAQLHEAMGVALSLAGQHPGYEGQLFDRVVKARSLMLDEMASRHQQAADAAVPGVANLRANLTAARQRLANLVVRGPGRQSVEQYLAVVEAARRDKQIAERSLAETSTVFRSEMARSDVGERAVREALPARTVLLSFYRHDRLSIRADRSPSSDGTTPPKYSPLTQSTPFYTAFILRSGAAAPTIVSIGDAGAIDALVSQWRRALTDDLTIENSTRAEKRLRNAGLLLRQRVWDPIAPYVEGADRVFVVPDGSLNLVPLAALPVAHADYLLERGPSLHYVSAERDLVRLDAPANVGKGLLALGAPSFEEYTSNARLQSPTTREEVRPAIAFRGSRSNCPNFQSMTFGGLPASGKEANAIAGLWKTSTRETTANPSVLLGRTADEASFKQLSPGRRVLHLATHGFFLGECAAGVDDTRSVGGLTSRKKPRPGVQKTAPPKATTAPPTGSATRENPLLLSGLALAGANRRASATGEEEDGILTAEEVASLDLSGVEWAVLSACDTGLGEIKAGEGVFGLRRAFQIAGAHTVIMSLWSVEDQAAMTWMRALYEGRLAKKLDTASAVRDASLSVLRQRRARGQSTHPFYWAGFVASGDWR